MILNPSATTMWLTDFLQLPNTWDKMGIVAVLGALLTLTLRVNWMQYKENRDKDTETLAMTARALSIIEKSTLVMEARERTSVEGLQILQAMRVEVIELRSKVDRFLDRHVTKKP